MLRTTFVVALAAVVISHAASGQRLTGAHPGAVPPPVILNDTGRFQARFAKVGDDLFIAGQPTEAALRAMRDSGVTTVVNLRSPSEMTRDVPFDEAALVKSLGMRYVYLPVRGTPDFPYSPATLRDFTRAMTVADGKVLLHCTIAWRASHLWAAYMIAERGVPVDTALAWSRRINLMDDHRMSEPGHAPIEEFLGRTVAQLGKGTSGGNH